jgi:hypothetical protein
LCEHGLGGGDAGRVCRDDFLILNAVIKAAARAGGGKFLWVRLDRHQKIQRSFKRALIDLATGIAERSWIVHLTLSALAEPRYTTV